MCNSAIRFWILESFFAGVTPSKNVEASHVYDIWTCYR